MNRPRGVALAAVAAVCLIAALLLAGTHPIAARCATVATLAWVAIIARWPCCWLYAIPAGLPVLNFGPWTGGLVFEEFDLWILATAAGLYLRMAAYETPPIRAGSRRPSGFVWAATVFGLASAAALARGLDLAGGLTSLKGAWFQGYEEPLNAWRVVKSVVWVALLWLPLRLTMRADPDVALRRWIVGTLVGLAFVVAAVLWERAAYPGLWHFTGRYRTTALFWEMHVGGGAIDAYLALCAPWVAWALVSARTPSSWGAAAVLALLVTYACLTTFSRGVYFAVAAPLALLGGMVAARRVGRRAHLLLGRTAGLGLVLLLIDMAMALAFEQDGYRGVGLGVAGLAAVAFASRHRFPAMRWRSGAFVGLALALLLEVVVVLGWGTYMRERIAASEGDLHSRLQHWKDGLGLMHGAADWAWGIGAGRLPAGYASRVPGVELPGDTKLLDRSPQPGSVLMLGPRTQSDMRGLLTLGQRVALQPGAPYKAEFDVRTITYSVLYVRVCEMHLLYPRQCQTRYFGLPPDPGQWRHFSLPLQGQSLTKGSGFWPRNAVFMFAVANAGGAAEFANLGLKGPAGDQLLANGDFSNGLARWLPVALGYFVPWHVDNLYLELLIERGAWGLLAFAACVAIVLRRLWASEGSNAPFLVASLCGGLCAGLVVSIMDVPRVAFFLLFLLIVGAENAAATFERGRVRRLRGDDRRRST